MECNWLMTKKTNSNIASSEKIQVLTVVLLAVILISSFMTLIPLSEVNDLPRLVRVACVGDSITAGTEYPNDLQQLLGENFTVRNFGAGGTTVLTSSNHTYMYNLEFREAASFHPDIVIIMLGTNDANPRYFDRIRNFVGAYEQLISFFQREHPKIWLLKPPPIFNDDFGPTEENLVNGVMPRIQQVATELNLPTINIYPLLIDHPDYFWDGLHPNWQGAKVIANAIYQELSNSTFDLR
jgi:lysophospholipase L1-like esterase